jgi:hypothetical protein
LRASLRCGNLSLVLVRCNEPARCSLFPHAAKFSKPQIPRRTSSKKAILLEHGIRTVGTLITCRTLPFRTPRAGVRHCWSWRPSHWKRREHSRSALRKRIANNFSRATLFCNAPELAISDLAFRCKDVRLCKPRHGSLPSQLQLRPCCSCGRRGNDAGVQRDSTIESSSFLSFSPFRCSTLPLP